MLKNILFAGQKRPSNPNKEEDKNNCRSASLSSFTSWINSASYVLSVYTADWKDPFFLTRQEPSNITLLPNRSHWADTFIFIICKPPSLTVFNVPLILPCIKREDWKRGKQSLDLELLKWQCCPLGTWAKQTDLYWSHLLHAIPSLAQQQPPRERGIRRVRRRASQTVHFQR